MKNRLFPFLFLFLCSYWVKAQTFTNSNLPIVVITTDVDPGTGLPRVIPDEPKVLGNMKIIYRTDGSRNYLTDINTPQYLNYDGRIAIETKGSSSQALPKKPYSLTTLLSDNSTNNNVAILGMPKENDWVLNALAFDSSLIRDALSYELSRKLGNYAARGKYCEVVVNNSYRGLYVFMEKLKVDENRINITKMTTSDILGSNLTGGYITKSDKTTGGDPVAFTLPTFSGWTVDFIHEKPSPVEITNEQDNYIYNQFAALDNVTSNQNSSIANGYPSIIDVPSFIDFMLINELSSNVDAYQFSTFFHKERTGKLRAGPIWDLNLTYGNDLKQWGLDRSFTNVWQFDNGDNTGAAFWKELYDNPTFRCYLTKRWKETSAASQPLHVTTINSTIDSLVTLISEASGREETRWGCVGNHTTAISTLKSWIQNRITWMNANLTNYSACANPILPPLVISKIHYHPNFIVPYGSDSLEFIEITNNGNNSVNLTGIYFRELGMTYQFPVNATIGPFEKIHLAANSYAYTNHYGVAPFGTYTRFLSNKSHKLILADAFGNEIDYVEYQDKTPWPAEADGTGACLRLVDLALDNRLASSWVADYNVTSTSIKIMGTNRFEVYPNPFRDVLYITTSKSKLVGYELFNVIGKKILESSNINVSDYILNTETLSSNTYLLKLLFENGEQSIVKINKH